jgi:hypothetical protein
MNSRIALVFRDCGKTRWPLYSYTGDEAVCGETPNVIGTSSLPLQNATTKRSSTLTIQEIKYHAES